ncbi:MAG TPA: hypothetical protein V6C72_03720 [Chroococcales cyanobacterium]
MNQRNSSGLPELSLGAVIQVKTLQLADICRAYRMAVITAGRKRTLAISPANARLMELPLKTGYILLGMIGQIHSLADMLPGGWERDRLNREARDLSEIRKLQPFSETYEDPYVLCETLESVGSILAALQSLAAGSETAEGAIESVYGSVTEIMQDFDDVLAAAHELLGAGKSYARDPGRCRITLAYGERLIGDARLASKAGSVLHCHAKIIHGLMSDAMDAILNEDYKLALECVARCKETAAPHRK